MTRFFIAQRPAFALDSGSPSASTPASDSRDAWLPDASSMPDWQLLGTVILMRHGTRAPRNAAKLSDYASMRWPAWPVDHAQLTPHGAVSVGYMGQCIVNWLDSQSALHGNGPQDDTLFIYADVDDRTFDSGIAIARTLSPSQPEQRVHSGARQDIDPVFHGVTSSACAIDTDKARADIAAYFAKGTVNQALDALREKHRSILETLSAQVGFADSNLFRSLHAGGVIGKQATIADIRGTLEQKDHHGSLALTGALAIGSDIASAFFVQHAQDFSSEHVAWGTPTTPTQWLALGSLLNDSHKVLLQTPYLASRRGTPMMRHILASLRQAQTSMPLAKAKIIIGHHKNLLAIAGMLGIDWSLPGQPVRAAAGEAMIFALWRNDAQDRDYVQIRVVTQTMEQLRHPAPLTSANQPPSIVLIPPACEKKGTYDMCEFDDFVRLTMATLTPDPC